MSNSETALNAAIGRCIDSLQRGAQGGIASLQAYRDAGAALRELKDVAPRGQFGTLAASRCGCSKQWRARLIKLDARWDDVQTAMLWAEGAGKLLARKGFSVDGALALLSAWSRGQNGDCHSPEVASEARRRSVSLAAQNSLLRRQLDEAAIHIAALEAELAKLRAPRTVGQVVALLQGPVHFPSAAATP